MIVDMSDEPKNIEDFTREYLRRIDRKLDRAGNRLDAVEQDVSILKEAVRRIDARVASMDSHMAGFYSATRWQTDEIDALKGRVETLEDRLPDDPSK